jgi:hypothetical protein
VGKALNECRMVFAGVVDCSHLIGGVDGDGERVLAHIDADIECRCLCCVGHRLVPPVGYSWCCEPCPVCAPSWCFGRVALARVRAMVRVGVGRMLRTGLLSQGG